MPSDVTLRASPQSAPRQRRVTRPCSEIEGSSAPLLLRYRCCWGAGISPSNWLPFLRHCAQTRSSTVALTSPASTIITPVVRASRALLGSLVPLRKRNQDERSRRCVLAAGHFSSCFVASTSGDRLGLLVGDHCRSLVRESASLALCPTASQQIESLSQKPARGVAVAPSVA